MIGVVLPVVVVVVVVVIVYFEESGPCYKQS